VLGGRHGSLPGGVANRGRVIRVGPTVHRPLNPAYPATHGLLRHLAAVRFAGAPRVIDVYGETEVLSYIEGTAANSPTPEWALTDDALVSVGLLLRGYHQHVASFGPGERVWARDVPVEWRGDLVTHNDPHPANVIFRSGRAMALIDFDLASPGCAAWELSVAACFWVPFVAAEDVPDSRRGQHLRRLRLLLDAYQASAEERRDAVRASMAANAWIAAIIEEGHHAGHTAFAELWTVREAMHGRAGAWIHDHYTELMATATRPA
jgi:hypothetical protein